MNFNNSHQYSYRRIVLRRGNEYLLFRTEDIAYFFLENKTCFMVDLQQGIKYMIPKSLRELTNSLDPAQFYRINKKYLVSINSVRKFKLCIGGRVEIELYPAPREKVFINQLRMQDFRRWVATGISSTGDHYAGNHIIQDGLMPVET
jgi:two-component system LytT family response regulator